MTDREQTFQVSTMRHYDSTTTTTWDEPEPGLLLGISIEDGNYAVRDLIGMRYGFAPFLKDAVDGWAEQVEDILGMQEEKLGDPLLCEVMAYKKALSR